MPNKNAIMHLLFIAFHLLSLTFCALATRTTFHYLSKHHYTPKTRYLLFGFVRTRTVGFSYFFSIFLLSTSSILIALMDYFAS